MKHILFVCLGNICRSPMAEFVMKHKLKEKGLEHKFLVESAATSSYEVGSDTHRGTKMELQKYGIATPKRMARQVVPCDYINYDYIVYMDNANYRDLMAVFKQDPDRKLHKMMSFVGSGDDVADPWYTHNFSATFDDINKACDALITKLLEETRHENA